MFPHAIMLLRRRQPFRPTPYMITGFALNTGVHKVDIEAARHEIEADLKWIKSKASIEVLSSRIESPINVSVKQNMTDYLMHRGYSSSLAIPEAVRTLSALFTYPTTLSFAINNTFRHPVDNLSVCIIGTRAEQTLPKKWWQELLFSTAQVNKFNITMIGAKATSNKDRENDENKELVSSTVIEWEMPVSVSSSSSSSLMKREAIMTFVQYPLHKHIFHELSDVDKYLLHNDIFVLYNPGLGSIAHKEQWKPTIQLLLNTKKPIVCTALSTADMNRDLKYLYSIAVEEDDQELGDPIEFLLGPMENPFLSLRKMINEMEETEEHKIGQSNHSIYIIQAK